MVGELHVAIADQEATILFLDDRVVLRFAGYKSALAIAKFALPSPARFGKLLSFSEIGLRAQVGKRRSIELFPSPSFIVRWLSRPVREMVQAAKN